MQGTAADYSEVVCIIHFRIIKSEFVLTVNTDVEPLCLPISLPPFSD